MKFKKVVVEINSTLSSISLFGLFLNSIVVYLAFYLTFLLIGVKPIYAFVPGLGYFIALAYPTFKDNKIRRIEKRYPELNEKLRTAADNMDKKNPVVEDLCKECAHEMYHVEVSSFLSPGKVSSRIIAATLLCFLVLYLTAIDIQPLQIDNLWDNVAEGIGQAIGSRENDANTFAGGPSGAGQSTTQGDILGIPAWIKLGSEQDVQIETAGYEVNIRDIKEAKQQDFDGDWPDEVFAQGASAFEDNIPKEQQELVKSYFEKLAGG